MSHNLQKRSLKQILKDLIKKSIHSQSLRFLIAQKANLPKFQKYHKTPKLVNQKIKNQ